MQGRVIAVWTKPDVDGAAPVRNQELQLLAEKGVIGDRHFGNRKGRQVLLVESGCLEQLGLSPGDLREQITVELQGLQNLASGAELRLGAARVRITGDCAPCRSMAGYLGEDPKEFVARAMSKRGMLGVVVADGSVKDGDAVEVLGTEPLQVSDTLE